MSRSSNIIAGLFGTFALSCAVMVLAPQAQLGGLQPQFTEDEPGKYTDIYPIQNGAMEQGRAIYVQEGCVSCHTQQVRDPQNGTDIERGWGTRRTVARDYLFDNPPLLGSQRLGPDLANIGSPDWRDEQKDDTRKPKKRNEAWHYQHLYAPRSIVSESNHPPYRYLFEVRKISGQRSSDALNVEDPTIPAGSEAVPTDAARSLASYLVSLDRSHPLKEAASSSAPAASPPATGAAPAAPAAAAPATPATPAK